MPLPIPEPRNSGLTTTTDVPLYWAAYGAEGSPRLIILHGGPGADHRYMLPQMLHLAARYDLLFYDQRGSGKSRASDNTPITWRTHVEDLAQLAHELGASTPVLLGYSWGAMLALLYSIQALADGSGIPAPGALALVSPAPLTRVYRAQFEGSFRARSNTPELLAARAALASSGLRERDSEAYRQRVFELSVAGYFADPARAHDLTPFRVVARVQQSTWDSLGDYDLIPRLRGIRAPSLIVHGRDDPIPAASSIDAARAMGTQLVLLDECGHVPYVEQPAELWGALDPFLAATGARPVS